VRVLVAALVFGSGGGLAKAADMDPSQAEELIRQGVELRQAGQDSRALALFEKAYEKERTPRSAGQLGLCELALGYWVNAETHLGEATASTGNPWVEKYRVTLAGALSRAKENVGTVSVVGGPAGAKVFVDHQAVGALPLERPLRLNSGPHDVEVRSGGAVQARSIAVVGTKEQTVTLALEVASAEPAAVAVAAPVMSAPANGHLVSNDNDKATSATGSRRTVAWVAAAVATAALVWGGVETVAWARDLTKFDDHKDPTGKFNDCGNGDTGYGGAGCAAIHEDLSRARTLAIVGLGAGIAVAAGATYLFATSSAQQPRTVVALPCALDVAGKGFVCRTSF